MTNFEKLKNADIDEMSQLLCKAIEDITDDYPCDHCFMEGRCSDGHNGWADWLKEAEWSN